MNRHPTRRRWLKRIGIAAAVLLVLLGIGLWWLLGTTSGLHFVLARAIGASNGALEVQASRGSLAGPLELDGVAYRDVEAGIDARIKRIRTDLAVWSLLSGTVRLTHLEVDGTRVALTSTTPPEEAEESSDLSLKPPLDIVLDRVRVRDVDVTQDDQPLFEADSLDLAGAWTAEGLDLKTLKLRSPDGHADLAGRVALVPGYRGKGHGEFQWKVGDDVWAGALDAASDGTQATLTLVLSRPVPLHLDLALEQRDGTPWQARLSIPSSDPSPLLGDTSIKTLALDLKARGNREGGDLRGDIDIDRTRLHVEPLELRYDPGKQRVTLQRLVLTSPQIKGTLEGRGRLDLAATPASADLHLTWHDVLLPEDIAGQELASSGDIRFNGSAEKYALEGKVDAGPPGRPAHISLDLSGTPKQVLLDSLAIHQAKGQLDTRGTLTLKPAMAWDLAIKGERFDPGQLLAGWDGALDLDLTTQGTLSDAGPDATLVLDKLTGTLRQRRIQGHGKLHVTPRRIVNGTLALASGRSTVDIQAHGTASNHVDLDLAIRSLNDWLPDASGSLNGHVTLTGLWPALAARGQLHGRALAMDENRADAVDITFDVPDISHPGGDLQLKGRQLAAAGLTFDNLALTGHGNADRHEVRLEARGEPLSLTLALDGHMKGEAWNGTLSTLDLEPLGMPAWRLEAPARLAWDHGRASLSDTCLTAGEPRLCLAATQAANGALEASYHLDRIPLALITTAVGDDLPLRSEGVINGEGRINRSAAGDLSGQATLVSPQGSIHYTDRPDTPLLAYHDFNVRADLAPDRQHVTLSARMDEGGHLAGDIGINGPQQALAGEVTLRLESLAPIELFTSELADVKGHLDGRFQLGGTLAAPDIHGQARLEEFAAEVPAAGLQLHDGQVTVATRDKQLDIDGHIGSGEGTLTLAGHVGMGNEAGTQLTVSGKQVEAANIPAAKVTISPALKLTRDAEGMNVTGSVAIDKADVELEKLPGGGGDGVQPSRDVVVVDDEKKAEEEAALPVTADITVNLGEHTHLEGYGMDGSVSGSLNVRQRPGRATLGRGQIQIDGTYKAYGQDLTIEKGRLLFASTPVDNPGLNIRAVRSLNPNATIDEGQVVGLLISGTARRPVMTVFSNPAMEQSDALSYLITGKPLSSVEGGEGDMVNAAAQALGSATGDLLAKGIGAKLGIDAGVSNSAALGTAAFTVGKYLSPRLYLSYGVGLFDPGQVITLRYILSRRWNFEAEQATEFSRASFNYRIEK